MKNKKPAYSMSDFEEAMLPHNRKQQFKFILKTRKGLLFLLGALLLVFCLPLIVSFVIKDISISNLYYLYVNEGHELDDAFFNAYLINQEFYGIIMAISFLIIDIGLAGTFGIYKKLMFGEPIFFWQDYKNGIKGNIKSFIIITLFFDLFLIGTIVLFRFLFLDIIFIIFFFVFIFLIFPYFMGIILYKSIYKAGFIQTFKVGFSIYGLRHIKGILIFLGLIIIPLSSNILADLMIITPTINLFILVIYFVIFVPFYSLIIFSYYYDLFDNHINKTQFPDFYLKGLFNPDMKTNSSLKDKEPNENENIVQK